MEKTTNIKHLLATKRFLPLMVCQFLGAFNDNIFRNALIILITFKLISDSSQAQMLVNLAGAVFIVPFFLFSALAGQLADTFNKDILGGYLGISGGFGGWFIMGLKVHFANFGQVTGLGPGTGDLKGPIYILSLGGAFGA